MKLKLEKTKAFWLYILGGTLSIALGIMLMPFWSKLEKSVFFESWGGVSVNIMISGLLFAYVLLFLVKRIRRYSGSPAQVVAIVELVVMVVIATVCTISMVVEEISFGGPCQIVGLVLWTRGISGVFTGYYCDSEFVAELERKSKENKKGKKDPKKDEKDDEDKDEDEKKDKKDSKKGDKDKKDNKKDEKKDSKKDEIDTDAEPRGRVDDFTVWRLTASVAIISLGTYMFIKPPFGALLLQWVFSGVISCVGLFFLVFGCAMKPNKIKVEEKEAKPDEDESEEAEDKIDNSQDSDKIDDKKDRKEKPKALGEGKVNIKLDGNTDNAKADEASSEPEKQESTALVPVDNKKKKSKK